MCWAKNSKGAIEKDNKVILWRGFKTIMLCKINCIAQMITDEKKQMIADISDDICDHLVSFNLC